MKPTLAPNQFESLHEFLLESQTKSYNGINGILHTKGSLDGPTSAISVMTHGNEYAGLTAVQQISPLLKNLQDFIRGEILFVINNIHAANSFFSALKQQDYDLTKLQSRTDTNRFRKTKRGQDMNRLPVNTIHQPPLSYEAKRIQSLQPIHHGIDGILDIHTMPDIHETMVINDTKGLLRERMQIDKNLLGIIEHQKDKPSIYFTGTGKDIPRIGFEAGQHDNPESVANAIQSALHFLLAQGNIKTDPENPIPPRDSTVIGSVSVPDSDFELIKPFQTGEIIDEGDVIARNHETGEEVLAPQSGRVLFPPNSTEIFDANKEVFFLTSL